VRDEFNTGTLENLAWNLYSPRWASLQVADFPSTTNRSLELRDRDPADYARAVRIFPETKKATVRFKILAKQTDHGRLEIELLDRHGYRPPVVIIFNEQGRVLAKDGNQNEIVTLMRFTAGQWYDIGVRFDQAQGRFAVMIDGQPVLSDAEFLDPVASLERITFRTGEFRTSPTTRDPKSPGEDFPSADAPVAEAIFYVDDMTVIE
jgi:hypothetical protein